MSPRPQRDILIHNCSVITMDGERAPAPAIALRAGRVLAVGESAQIERQLTPDAVRVDGDGAWLAPAFHDSHVHLAHHGFEIGQVNLHDAGTLAEGIERVAEQAARTPAGGWVLGAGFALDRWGVDTLDRTMLDRVAPNHPVLLRSQDHHSAWVNSRALERAGVTAATPDPAEGRVVRDGRGEPTGLLLERALHLVWDHVEPPGEEAIEEAVALAGRDLASRGIATVHHMAYEPPAYWRTIALAASREEFPLRVWSCINQEEIEMAARIGLATGQGGGGFAIGGAKFFADGALGSRTAWMLEPYGGTDQTGVAVHGPELLRERFPLAIRAGLAPVVHAIGDAAVRAVVDALAETRSLWHARGLRPRIEHVQHATEEDVERIAALGIVASMQPIHLTFDRAAIMTSLSDRVGRAYAIRDLLRAGARVAFGSDTPVARPDVLAGLRAARDRVAVDGEVLGPGQRITPFEALHGYTRGAAWAIGREESSGVLLPGYDADIVFLSGDPLGPLDDVRVRATLKGGRPTFDPEGFLQQGYTSA